MTWARGILNLICSMSLYIGICSIEKTIKKCLGVGGGHLEVIGAQLAVYNSYRLQSTLRLS